MLLIILQEDHTRHFLQKCLVPFLFREPWFNLRQSPIFQQELYSNFLWSSAEVFPLKLASIASAHQHQVIDHSTLPNKRLLLELSDFPSVRALTRSQAGINDVFRFRWLSRFAATTPVNFSEVGVQLSTFSVYLPQEQPRTFSDVVVSDICGELREACSADRLLQSWQLGSHGWTE